jgi:hypothetical protein
MPENMSVFRIQAHFVRVVCNQADEAIRQQASQGILVPVTESIGKWLKAMAAENEALVLNFPEVFALALVEDEC